MASNFNLRAIISATDRLTPVLRAQQRQIESWRRSFAHAGKNAIPMAAGLGAALYSPAKAFANLESASLHLQNTLMGKDGLSKGFEEIKKQTILLGNDLPGTTEDFMLMAAKLNSKGLSPETLLGGTLKATAYLAVVGEKLGVTYDSAAEAMGTLSNTMGIAEKDSTKFADSLARALNIGVELPDLQYAMSGVSGSLHKAGKIGLQAAEELLPMIGLLNNIGIKGENAGTGLNELFSVAIKSGKFKSFKQVVADIDKLSKLNPSKALTLGEKLFGKDHARKILNLNVKDYEKIQEKLKNQGTIYQKVENMSNGLENKTDSLLGTLTNTSAVLGNVYAPQLKIAADYMNNFIIKAGEFIANNKKLIKTAIEASIAFVGWKLTALGVVVALGFIKKAINLLVSGTLLGRILLIGQTLATLAPIVYENWGAITTFIKDAFNSAIDWILHKWDALKDIFSSITNLFPSSSGMSLPNSSRPEARKSIINSSRSNLNATLDINHNNAPQGFRAAPIKSQGPWRVEQNVGYRSFALSMPY
ncbi:MAG: phage tail tape measure protein [Methylococcales bacterium]|nr:phage tail tape measure protein [Methylococcales bacterium]